MTPAHAAPLPASTDLVQQLYEPHYAALCLAGDFLPDALTANAAGVLTPAQQAALRGHLHSGPEAGHRFGLPPSLVVTLLLFGAGASPMLYSDNVVGLWVGAILGFVSLSVVARLLLARHRLAQDLAAGQVATVEGVGQKIALHKAREAITHPRWSLRVGGETFRIEPRLANLVNEGHAYRIHFLPRSRSLLQIVPLSPPVAEEGENG
jgi:hypothetical protein